MMLNRRAQVSPPLTQTIPNSGYVDYGWGVRVSQESF